VFINIFHHDLVKDMISAPAKMTTDKAGIECQTFDVIIPEKAYQEITDDEYYFDMVCAFINTNVVAYTIAYDVRWSYHLGV
jgi:hypothetical protein